MRQSEDNLYENKWPFERSMAMFLFFQIPVYDMPMLEVLCNGVQTVSRCLFPGTLCPGFHCRGGEMCIDTKGLLCNPLPRYCIDKSLVCNDLPNCGAYDTSDEDGCEYYNSSQFPQKCLKYHCSYVEGGA